MLDKRFIFSNIQLPEKYSAYDPALSNGTLSDSNTVCAGGSWTGGRGDVWVSEGKWYFEILVVAAGHIDNQGLGIASMKFPIRTFGWPGPGLWGTRGSEFNHNGGREVYKGGYCTCASGHTIRVAFDFFRGYVWFGDEVGWKQGGDPQHGLNPIITNLTSNGGADPVAIMTVAYWGTHKILKPSEYKYPVPYGFLPLAKY